MENVVKISRRARRIAAREMRHITQLSIISFVEGERPLRYSKQVARGAVRTEIEVLHTMVDLLETAGAELPVSIQIEVWFGTSTRFKRLAVVEPAVRAREFGCNLYKTIESFAAVMVDNEGRRVVDLESIVPTQKTADSPWSGGVV